MPAQMKWLPCRYSILIKDFDKRNISLIHVVGLASERDPNIELCSRINKVYGPRLWSA